MIKTKKISYFTGLITFIMIFNVIFIPGVFGKNGKPPGRAVLESVKSQKILRGKAFDDNFMCVETFEYFPEEKIKTDEGDIYKKIIKSKKEFQKNKKNNVFKTEAEHKIKITFTYDKKTFVKIENIEEDIVSEKVNDKWEVIDLTEVLPSKNTCLISTKLLLYKSSVLGNKIYLGNSHLDIFCSTLGKIGINTELH